MCGGRGTRLDADAEKPLFEVGGEPMVDRVADALAASAAGTTYAVTSPHAPETAAHVRDRGLATVGTPGDGYVADLTAALADDRIRPPVLTVAADLPLLAGDAVDAVLRTHGGGSLTVCVPTALKEMLGVSADAAADGRAPTGLNVVADDERDTMYTTYDARLAVNVNRTEDAAVAEALLCD
ncbi:NTP transferase domain-containing protein [Halostella litorea]|uniref:NTP transferase domain-containing protein n=1 Tax=Halostella litorea TaxID=2528831 RepID=UPI001092C5D1|nr:NTP transferase domain-containing protein [Halostella litorea]